MESGPVIRQYWLRQAGNCHPAPTSMDLRLRIVQAVEGGSSIRGAGRRFPSAPSAAIKLMQRVRATGSAAPERSGGHRRPLLDRTKPTCARWSRRRPISPWPSSRRRCSGAAAYGPGCRRSTMRSAGWACGEKKSPRAAEQDRPDVAGERQLWRAWQRFMDPARFVFLDETATATDMARRYGRGPSDRRLVAAVPHGHWRPTTFIAGLRPTGIIAPFVLDGRSPLALRLPRAMPSAASTPATVSPTSPPTSTASARRSPPPAPRSSTCRLQPRPGPDRAAVRQAQGPAAPGRRAHQGGPLVDHRPPPRRLLAPECSNLPPPLRLWFRLEWKCSW